jgi:hypothetical protein
MFLVFDLHFNNVISGVVDPHHFDADPDPTFHSDMDLYPNLQIKAQSLEKVLK